MACERHSYYQVDESEIITTADQQIGELSSFINKLQTDFESSFKNFKKEMIRSVKNNTIKYQKEWMRLSNEENVNPSFRRNVNEHSFNNSNLIDAKEFSRHTGMMAPGQVNMTKSIFSIYKLRKKGLQQFSRISF